MGTSTTNLMGGGLPAQLAADCGLTVVAVSGVGTAQTGGTILTGGNFYVLTTASSQTAFVLPANATIGTSLEAFCKTSTTALVFGAAGETVQGGSANASFSVAQNKSARFTKDASLTWVVNLSA